MILQFADHKTINQVISMSHDKQEPMESGCYHDIIIVSSSHDIIRVRNKEFYLHSKSAMHFLSCIAIHKFCIAICIAIFFYIKLSLQTFFSLYFQLRLEATVELVLVL